MIQCLNCSQSIPRKSLIDHQAQCSSNRFHRERASYNEQRDAFERNTTTRSTFQENMSDGAGIHLYNTCI